MIENLKKIGKGNIVGQYHQGRPDDFQKSWVPLTPPKNDIIIARSIFRNEIVFDFDTPSWNDVVSESSKIVEYLKKKSIPYLMGYSGGKGIHIHIFLDASKMDLAQEFASQMDEYKLDVSRIVREVLYDRIVRESCVDIKKGKLDRLKVSWASNNKGSIIREFGCTRANGSHKSLLTSVPENKPDGVECIIPTVGDMKMFDVSLMGNDIIKSIKNAIEKKAEAVKQDIDRGAPVYNEDLSKVPCYNSIMKGLASGSRHNGAFLISRMNWVYNVPYEMALRDIKIYAQKCDDPASVTQQSEITLDSVYRKSLTKGFSCRWLRETLGEEFCDRQNCPISWEHRVTTAHETTLANQTGMISQMKVLANGHLVNDWQNNEFIKEKVIRFGEITPDWSFKLFLIPEKVNIPQCNDINEEKKRRKAIARDYATHDDVPNTEFFPYLLCSFSHDLMEDPDTHARLPIPTKWVFPVRDLYGAFNLSVPDHPDIIKNQPSYIISKRIYQVRDKFEIDNSDLKKFLDQNIDGRTLFLKVKDQYKHYIEMKDEWYTFLALWTMATHFYWIFQAFPYVELWAPFSSGKSKILKISSMLSHMGEYVSDPSSPSVFRDIDATQCTVNVDESDNLMNVEKDPAAKQFLTVLLTGYESGPSIPRWNVDTKKVDRFNPYSPKMLATIKGLPTHLESRAIRPELMKSNDKKYAKREPFDAKPEFKKLSQEIVFWSITTGSEIAKMDMDAVVDKYESLFADAPLRTIQIMKPILCLYDHLHLDEVDGSSPSESENLAKMVAFIISDKEESVNETPEARILHALYDAVCSRGNVEITMDTIITNLHLENDEDRKFFNPRRIGLILRRYNLPKNSPGGHTRYFSEKGKRDMTPEARKEWVEDQMRRNNVNFEQGEVSNSFQPIVQIIIDVVAECGRSGIDISSLLSEPRIRNLAGVSSAINRLIKDGILMKMPNGNICKGASK